MATPVIVPKEGQDMEACRIIRWLKKKGETVGAGDILCEVETEKAAFDLEAPVEGVLLDIFYPDDSEAPLLTPVAVIGSPGEEYENLRPVSGAGRGSVRAGALEDVSGEGSSGNRNQASGGNVPGTQSEKRKPGISPRARRLALENAVDFSNVDGTGPDGHIIERDILSALSRLSGGRVSADRTRPDGTTDIPVRGSRKVISEKMLSSLRNSAQFTLHAPADASALVGLRKKFKNDPVNEGITINDMVLYSTAKTLSGFRELNSHLLNDRLRVFDHVNLGFAVDSPRGLAVPVIRDADRKSLKQISMEAESLTKRCRENKLRPADMEGGTFTVSNLGPYGIEYFTPILNPPETGILGVGVIFLKPVFREERFSFVPHIGFSLTVNHQAVDGALGARFLNALADGIKKIDPGG